MVAFKNTEQSWGWVAIVLHWVSVLVFVFLVALGLWMVELDYYHSWYRAAPDVHRSVGVVFMLLLAVRLCWRFFSTTPTIVGFDDERRDRSVTLLWQKRAAKAVHVLLYLLLLLMLPTGYLLTTAKGQGLSVFNVFEIPAIGGTLGRWLSGSEFLAAQLHQWCAYSLMVLVFIHGGAALWHHCIYRDNTLKRMLGRAD